jgi:cell division protein FtsB
MSSRYGTAKRQRRPRFVARRRLLLLFMVVVLVGVALLANYGPLQAYRDARARLDQAATAVSTLGQEKTQLQSELGRLSETGYLESLAREELTYTRPGEQLYIVTGLDEATGTSASDGVEAETATDATAGDSHSVASDEQGAAPADTGGEADRPGLFERALNAILGIF